MISRYADKNGDTPCMPDGFVPDIEARDYYTEPYPLGDERENLLRIALERAGKTDLAPISRSSISKVSLVTVLSSNKSPDIKKSLQSSDFA